MYRIREIGTVAHEPRRLAPDTERRLQAGALDALSIAIAAVDRHGRVLIANAAARALIEASDGIGIDACQMAVSTARTNETKMLRQLIAEAAAGGAPDDRALAVSRPSGKRALAVLILPLPACRGDHASDEPAAMLCIVDPDDRPSFGERRLARLLGLTSAEARLTAALASGMSLKAASARFQVSLNTTRTHLRQIFAKTGTNRQSDLVALVLRLVLLGVRPSPAPETPTRRSEQGEGLGRRPGGPWIAEFSESRSDR